MPMTPRDFGCTVCLVFALIFFNAFFWSTEWPEVYRHDKYVADVATVLYAYAEPRFCPYLNCLGCSANAAGAPVCSAIENSAAAHDPYTCAGAVDAGVAAANNAALAGRAAPSTSALPTPVSLPSPAPLNVTSNVTNGTVYYTNTTARLLLMSDAAAAVASATSLARGHASLKWRNSLGPAMEGDPRWSPNALPFDGALAHSAWRVVDSAALQAAADPVTDVALDSMPTTVTTASSTRVVDVHPPADLKSRACTAPADISFQRPLQRNVSAIREGRMLSGNLVGCPANVGSTCDNGYYCCATCCGATCQHCSTTTSCSGSGSHRSCSSHTSCYAYCCYEYCCSSTSHRSCQMFVPTCYTGTVYVSVNSTTDAGAFTGALTSDFGTDAGGAAGYVRSYPAGLKVIVYYDPKDPSGTLVLSVAYTPWKWVITAIASFLLLLPVTYFTFSFAKRAGMCGASGPCAGGCTVLHCQRNAEEPTSCCGRRQARAPVTASTASSNASQPTWYEDNVLAPPIASRVGKTTSADGATSASAYGGAAVSLATSTANPYSYPVTAGVPPSAPSGTPTTSGSYPAPYQADGTSTYTAPYQAGGPTATGPYPGSYQAGGPTVSGPYSGPYQAGMPAASGPYPGPDQTGVPAASGPYSGPYQAGGPTASGPYSGPYQAGVPAGSGPYQYPAQ